MLTDLIDSPAGNDRRSVADWLIGAASSPIDIEELVEGLASGLTASGCPVDRLTIGIPILLPHIAGMQFRWYRGAPVSRQTFPATAATLRQMEDSPVRAAYYEGRMTRCRISSAPDAGEFPIIADLRGEGFRDYAAFPVPFSDGTFKVLTVATRERCGFDDRHIKEIASLVGPLAPALEIRTLRHLTRALLDIYIGPTAGRKVLDGAIRRGEGEMIQAAVWFSDLRGSTDLSANMDGPALIALLNDFFGAVTGAVASHGGEILKFIGDSVLAIFPCSDRERMGCAAAMRAEAAADEAITRIAALNRMASDTGGRTIDFGIALHFGGVFFGNVGGEDRLDFTVIGQTVNLAARIESLCRDTGELLLVSEDFAKVSTSPFTPLGSFQLQGIDGWQAVYSRPDATADPETIAPSTMTAPREFLKSPQRPKE